MNNLKVEGMSCEHCLNRVKKAIEKLGGKNVEIDLSSGDVKFLGNVNKDELKSTIEDLGFKVL